jgi:manganese transport protein
MRFTSDRTLMGGFANRPVTKVVGYIVCTLIAGLNLSLLWQALGAFWFGGLVTVAAAFTVWVRFVYRGR